MPSAERDSSSSRPSISADIVGVDGYLFRPRTGELSVHAENSSSSSKTLLSMPEKWHGLEDVETRFRQRYLDLIANRVRQVFVTRARIVSSLRRQLEERGFIEVETPHDAALYGGAAARPFVTQPQHPRYRSVPAQLRRNCYLKRWWWADWSGLRNSIGISAYEGLSAHHNPRVHHARVLSGLTPITAASWISPAELLARTATTATGSAPVEFEGQKLDFSRLDPLQACAKPWSILGRRPPTVHGGRVQPRRLSGHSAKPTARPKPFTTSFERAPSSTS